MKHRIFGKKLGRDSAHTRAILCQLSTSILKYERITTTTAKAKCVRPFLEKLVTKSKKDTLNSRRMVYKSIRDTLVLKKLFEDIAKRYQDRNGGYLRIVHLGVRKGDAARLSSIELVEEKLVSVADPVA